MTTEERFWSKVERSSSGCWIWTGAKNADGYGTFWNGLRLPSGPQKVLAHRWAFDHFVRAVPEGLHVCHTCDTPSCVNYEEHLFVGTQADNVADCARKGRRNQSRDVKLTADDRAEIRRRYTGRRGEQTALAKEFGVSQPYISELVR